MSTPKSFEEAHEQISSKLRAHGLTIDALTDDSLVKFFMECDPENSLMVVEGVAGYAKFILSRPDLILLACKGDARRAQKLTEQAHLWNSLMNARKLVKILKGMGR